MTNAKCPPCNDLGTGEVCTCTRDCGRRPCLAGGAGWLASATEYELLLGGGKTDRWHGRDGADACVRYADAHRTATVLAWREPRVQLRVGY